MTQNDKAAGCCPKCKYNGHDDNYCVLYGNCICHSPTPRTEKKCEYCENGEYHKPNATYPCSKTYQEDDAIEVIVKEFKVKGLHLGYRNDGVSWLRTALRSYGEKYLESHAHETVEEYCCACDYDIVVLKEEGRREVVNVVREKVSIAAFLHESDRATILSILSLIAEMKK